jgi:hypothetical protein
LYDRISLSNRMRKHQLRENGCRGMEAEKKTGVNDMEEASESLME